MAVGELDTVLQNEGVGGGAVGVFHDVVVLNDNGLVFAVSNFHFAAHVLGAQHTDLGHSHDGAVSCGGVEEGVEQTVQLFGHDDECICTLAAAANEQADAQGDAKDHC